MSEQRQAGIEAPGDGDAGTRSGRVGLACVGLAAFLFSTSSVLVRWAAPLSPLEVTFWRSVIAASAVGVAALVVEKPITIRQVDLPRFALYGLAAALHFLFYVASLSFTTVAHSLTLIYTAPIFVTFFAAVILKEPIALRKYAGIAVTVAGVAVLVGLEPALTGEMLVGDFMALGSALCYGLYSVAGRSQRTRYPLLTYAAGVYGAAAFWLLPAALVSWTGAYTSSTVAAVVLLGLVPLAIGHTLYNAALRRMHPTYVNLVATQEVTGGVLLGALFLSELPGAGTVVGVALTLLGTVLVLL